MMLPPHRGQTRLMIDEITRGVDSQGSISKSAWLISDRSLKLTVATTARPVRVNCNPKTNFQTASYVRKDSYSGRIATSLSVPLTSIWHVTEHPRSSSE